MKMIDLQIDFDIESEIRVCSIKGVMMDENMMKKYLGDRYSTNHIINFINYWIEGYDKPRALSDLDCLYYDGDLNADTIFSVWTPIKFVLDCLNPKEKFYKYNKYGNPHKFLFIVKDNLDTLLPRDKEVVQELYRFAELAETRANYFKWPITGINKQRYGDDFDQMPPALYKCFPGGKYSSFFDNDAMVLFQWIEDQKLEDFFIGNSIEQKNIRPLISSMNANESKWLKDEIEILEMLKNYNSILQERSKYFTS